MDYSSVYMGGTSEIADAPLAHDTCFFSRSFRSLFRLVFARAAREEATSGSASPSLKRTPESAWKVSCFWERNACSFSSCRALLVPLGPALLSGSNEKVSGVAGR